jgi:hypothetical protein
MKRFLLSKLTCMLIMLLSLVLMTAQAASALSLNDYSWKIVKSPNGSYHNNLLNNAVAFSKDDAWAVGANYTGGEGPPVQGLIEHWNGSQWSIVQTPNIGSGGDYFQGIAVGSANDIWAVGAYVDLANHQQLTMIQHCC